MGRRQRIRVGPGFWVVTRESPCERTVRGWIPGNFLQKCPLCPLYPPPLSTTIRNETFFRVDGGWRGWQAAKGWLCLTYAQRYYTTLQFWQVTGSADGLYPGLLARFSPYLVSYAGSGRDARDPRRICNHLGCTHAALGASRIIQPLGSPMSADEKGSTEPESTHSLPSWPSANPEHPDSDNVSQRSWDTPGVCSDFCKCARDAVAITFGSGFCKCARDAVAKAFGAW